MASSKASAAAHVTIKDVAKAAGVSPTTVSHALNDRGQVDPLTRERVKETARRLGYRPNRHAQRLRTGEAHMIALISSMPFGVAGGPSRLGFLMEIAAVAASAALTRGLALVLVPPVESGSLRLDMLDVDAGLVVEPSAKDASVEHFRKRGLPVVTIGRQPGVRQPAPYVDLRSAETTDLMLDHLWVRGARRIALVIGDEQRNSHVESEAAYAAFARRRRMRSEVVRVVEGQGEEGGYQAARALLARRPELDALCVPVDAFASGAARAVTESGRRIPGDVMLITRYDGLRARTCQPPLTAVNMHLDETAQTAVELLFDHLRGSTSDRMRPGAAPQLVERESTTRL
ncbi:MAG TPA: LacI family DNA-binding transcriptional regulator [Ramlibacter sp.]|uniref:LacI family DNA-binding transcriptional regulator n=1 Tax=Ramlibacter sp. TaxID=1917967 RepID=UPI002B6795CF|nr:LacI family DNA-binding transcriptional regulator [Ramlibacter sp.]HVZ44043.1 LacI family DNA-binding transcriptional regulator [Ramlibacter sp.]